VPVRVLDVGDSGVLIELDAADDVLRLHAALSRARRASGAPLLEDLVPAERTVLVRFDPVRATPDVVRAWVASVRPDQASDLTPTETVEVAVRYDGIDLAEVGRLTGLGVDGVIEAHSGGLWTVGFVGFSPGFGYLIGGDPRLEVPRLSEPRVRVPAGAVALAGPYCGVYPRQSPGGWRIIGTTSTPVWDLTRDPPALFRPGVRVRFVAEDHA
jgi:KipI family sensor histidine kinase inhibitor